MYLVSSLSSPVSTMDYDAFTGVILNFPVCTQRICISAIIVDDLVDEPNESFFVNLERTPDLDGRIRLDPVVGEIEIEDNDGIYSITSITIIILILSPLPPSLPSSIYCCWL